MKQRQLEIIKKLMDTSDYIKPEKLADMFQVTDRTIRMDLEEISRFLESHKIPVQRDRRRGVGIDRTYLAEDKMREVLRDIRDKKDYYTSQERFDMILQLLLLSNSPHTIQEIMEEAKASKCTVIKDLKLCEEWFLNRNIRIIRRPNYGIKLGYDEIDWRKAVSEYLRSYLQEFNFLRFYYSFQDYDYLPFNLTINEFINKMISGINLISIKNFLRKYETDRHVYFTDEAFINTVFYICIALKRVSQGNEITRIEFQGLKALEKEEVSWLLGNLPVMEGGKELSETEAAYILVFMLSAKKFYTIVENKIEDFEEFYIISQFLNAVEGFLNVRLETDRELPKSLYMHIKPMIHRMKYNVQIENPLTGDIKVLYPQVFKSCEIGGKVISDFLGKPVSEDETAFLAMHIGAAIEKRFHTNTVRNFYRATVVCASGIGTGNMLCSRLLAEFPNLIIDGISSVEQLKEADWSQSDFIISTVPLSCGISKKILQVSPLLNQQDIIRLKGFMAARTFEEKNSNDYIVDELLNIISKECMIQDYDRLRRLLSNYFHQNYKTQLEDIIMLSDLMKPEHIQLNTSATDWEDAVRCAGNLLLDDGCIEEGYIEQMINTKKELGPFIVIAPGIAMPHARPEDGVNEVCMSFVTLKTGVEFGNPENDPVRLVIALGAVDNTSHMHALSDLVEFLDSKENIENLYQCREEKELIGLIEKFEKEK